MYDAIDPGTLDRRVVIQTYTVAKDSYGQAVKTWATHTTVQASMNYDTGAEGETANEQVATSKVRWVIRYLSTVTEKMRIYYGSDYYYIEQVKILGRLQYMELITEKRDND
jgi:SPP1 family predicted phage head-tail adaptor